MMVPPRKVAPENLQSIPGVGPSLARVLRDLKILQVSDLRDRDPETMFDNLCALRGQKIDRCVLYVFRCATYFAEGPPHDPELLKWWNWKDNRVAELVRAGHRGAELESHA